MYRNYNPSASAPQDDVTFDPVPDADAGKSKMYSADPGLPYSNGRANQKSLDVGSGIPAGSVSHKSAHDPNYPMRR